MAMPNPYQVYQQQSVMTASPGDLTLMLFNGCLKFMGRAELALEKKDLAGAHEALLRAQDIIAELMSSLDMQYELSGNLLALYEFIYRHLVQANIKKDPSLIAEAVALVAELRDAWAEAVQVTRAR
ncbi:MAG: flagellar export chaperone FliS [Firmicutes bacterium]|nr:flagellar export chaperone FliS [Dethiobacter sp.]MBS3888631.1 flagellar export chaperone FliS [Bacillota bacterium]